MAAKGAEVLAKEYQVTQTGVNTLSLTLYGRNYFSQRYVTVLLKIQYQPFGLIPKYTYPAATASPSHVVPEEVKVSLTPS